MGTLKTVPPSTTIGEALFSKTQQRVLGLLYGRPDRHFYTNEIVRRAGVGTGTVRRELERLVAAGLLEVSREGNQVYYRARPDNPIYGELIAIVRKTFGIADVVRAALAPLERDIVIAFIYGSIAKGEETPDSDVDLLVVSDTLTYEDAMNIVPDMERSLGRTVSPTIYSKAELKKRVREKNAFVTRLMEQPKLWMKGSDNDLGESTKPGRNKTTKT